MLTKFKNILAQRLAPDLELSVEEVQAALELPKDSSLGDLAFPCFSLAKKWRKGPPQIAQELVQKFHTLPAGFKNVQNVSGYLNFFFDDSFLAKDVLGEIQKQKESFGNTQTHAGKCAVFDYSSPNVAKPMNIGHLRSTVIGQALVNIYRTMGFKTVGINYLGDWGVQFGKLAWAHLNLKDLLVFARQNEIKIISSGFKKEYWQKLLDDAENKSDSSFDYLFAVYVIFHACAELDEKFEEFGREYFLKLEKRNGKEGQKDRLTASIEQTWKKFVDASLVEYNRVYKMLRIKHDLVRGESFYEPFLAGVVDKLKEKGLLKLSEGAQIVDLSAFEMPPCLIQKSDGATLYATRDIAAAINRREEFHGDQLVYVVGAEQTLHFKQFFKVLELMGYEWAKDAVHVPFGLYRFKEGKMSTRRGNVVLLEDVLDRAVELVRDIIREKNPDLKNAEEVAEAVGTGAVIFNDLMNDRQTNIDFDWDKVLDFNGDTGPYVQYSHVRCCSVLSKWGKDVPAVGDVKPLAEKLEKDILRVLLRFDVALQAAFDQRKPNWIAQYLLDLSKAFNAFYYEHRILEGDPDIQRSRIVLVDCVRIVLAKGLHLLGIQTPEAM